MIIIISPNGAYKARASPPFSNLLSRIGITILTSVLRTDIKLNNNFGAVENE